MRTRDSDQLQNPLSNPKSDSMFLHLPISIPQTLLSHSDCLAIRTSLFMQNLKQDSLHWMRGKPCSVHLTRDIFQAYLGFRKPLQEPSPLSSAGSVFMWQGKEGVTTYIRSFPGMLALRVLLQDTIMFCLSKLHLKDAFAVPRIQWTWELATGLSVAHLLPSSLADCSFLKDMLTS